MAYQVFYPKWSAGESTSGWVQIKCYVTPPLRDDGPCVFLELRALVQQLELPDGTPPLKWFKRHGELGPQVKKHLPLFRAEASDILLSEKRVKALAATASWTPVETLFSIKMAILHLSDWAGRLFPARRKKASDTLMDMLSKILGAKTIFAGDDFQQLLVSQDACQHRDGGGRCMCIMKSFSACDIDRSINIEQFVKLLVHFRGPAQRHPCCLACWASIVQWLSSRCEEQFGGQCRFDKHGEGLGSQPRGPHKRRRLDQDLRVHHTLSMVKSKRFKSAIGAAASGLLDMSVTAAWRHEHLVCAKYIKEAAALMAGARLVVVGVDESSCHEPTMVGYVWHPAHRKACWLVPQVLRGWSWGGAWVSGS